MDSPILVPGVAAQPTPRIQGVTCQTADVLQTRLQALIDAAATANPATIVTSFDVGQSGERQFWGVLGFAAPTDYPGESAVGQFAWAEFDTPAAPQVVAIAAQDTPVLIPGATLLAGSVGFSQAVPGDGIVVYDGAFGVGSTFTIDYTASVASATANTTIARISLLINGVQMVSSLRSESTPQNLFAAVTGRALQTLVPGDTVSVAIENATNDDDYNVASVNLVLKSQNEGVFPNLNGSLLAAEANVAVVEVGTVDGMGQTPTTRLIERIAALSPAPAQNFVYKIQPIGSGSGGPAFSLAALFRVVPGP